MMDTTKKAILESIRYDKLYNVAVNPFSNTCVINIKMLDQDNVMLLMEQINAISADETRTMRFVILYSSNKYKEYGASVGYTLDDFLIDFTDELEKRDLERYALLLNPIEVKKEELV